MELVQVFFFAVETIAISIYSAYISYIAYLRASDPSSDSDNTSISLFGQWHTQERREAGMLSPQDKVVIARSQDKITRYATAVSWSEVRRGRRGAAADRETRNTTTPRKYDMLCVFYAAGWYLWYTSRASLDFRLLIVLVVDFRHHVNTKSQRFHRLISRQNLQLRFTVV